MDVDVDAEAIMQDPTLTMRDGEQRKVVIVTGGTRGIGFGIAQAFLDAGAEVVVCSRKQPESLPHAGQRAAIFVAADVRNVEAIEAVVSEATSRFGRLDVLVNNAGGSPMVDAATVSPP